MRTRLHHLPQATSTTQPPWRPRAERLRPEHLGAIRRIPSPQPRPAPSYLDAYPGPTRPR